MFVYLRPFYGHTFLYRLSMSAVIPPERDGQAGIFMAHTLQHFNSLGHCSHKVSTTVRCGFRNSSKALKKSGHVMIQLRIAGGVYRVHSGNPEPKK